MINVFIIAGEASGDLLGAALMSGLRSQTDAKFDGVGGAMMAEEGLQSRFPWRNFRFLALSKFCLATVNCDVAFAKWPRR